MKKIALIGVNYAASLAMDIAKSKGEIHSFHFFDDNAAKRNKHFFDTEVVGNVNDFIKQKEHYIGAVVCIGDKHLAAKENICDRLRGEGIALLNFISSQVHSLNPTAIGTGCIIGAGVYLGQRSKVDDDCIIWANATLEHDVKLGHTCYVGPGAVLSGCVEVGAYTMIGSNATILPEIKIGEHCKIGAGAVVTKNVPDGATVVGVPAKNI